MELVKSAELGRWNSFELHMKEIEKKFLHGENHCVGRVMDQLKEEFQRSPAQQIMHYDNGFEKEYIRLVKIAGELNETWKVHLYFKKMNIKYR